MWTARRWILRRGLWMRPGIRYRYIVRHTSITHISTIVSRIMIKRRKTTERPKLQVKVQDLWCRRMLLMKTIFQVNAQPHRASWQSSQPRFMHARETMQGAFQSSQRVEAIIIQACPQGCASSLLFSTLLLYFRLYSFRLLCRSEWPFVFG
jgi:hypothetical protein